MALEMYENITAKTYNSAASLCFYASFLQALDFNFANQRPVTEERVHIKLFTVWVCNPPTHCQ